MSLRRSIAGSCLMFLLPALPTDAPAAPFPEVWQFGAPPHSVTQWSPTIVDLNGDGVPEIVNIEIADPPPNATGRLCIRRMDTGQPQFCSPDLQEPDSVRSIEIVDVDGDGLPDVVLKGAVEMSGVPAANLLVFGFGGLDFEIKDFVTLPVPIQPHYYAQLFADPPLELVALQARTTGVLYGRFQVHRFATPTPIADVEPVASTETPVVQFVDTDGNGVQEMICGQGGYVFLYASADAFVGAPVPTAGASGGLALSRAWPNPAREDVQLGFAMAAAGDARLRVIDAAGRAVRTEQRRGLAPGAHAWQWDGRDDGGRALAAGVYWLEVEANGERGSRKVVRLR